MRTNHDWLNDILGTAIVVQEIGEKRRPVEATQAERAYSLRRAEANGYRVATFHDLVVLDGRL